LLGGASREFVTVYGHASGDTIDAAVQSAAEYVGRGYRAVRVQTSVPGVQGTYGVAKGDHYEPAVRGAAPEMTVWNTPPYLDVVPKLFAALRDALGPDLHLLHDVHHRLTPIEAARLGASLEPYRLFWMEDPTPAENQETFRLIRQHTTTPLAAGEVFNSIHDCRQLIEEQLIDYIRTSVVH